MRKIAINVKHGGFSLSSKALQRLSELQGRKCYFFKMDFAGREYVPVEAPDGERDMFLTAFDIPNPDEVLDGDKDWHEMTHEEKQAHNELYRRHEIDARPDKRDDPLLIQVIEELGDEANGACAKLAIIEIPDDVQWQIEEYDGFEHIAEKHRTWP